MGRLQHGSEVWQTAQGAIEEKMEVWCDEISEEFHRANEVPG